MNICTVLPIGFYKVFLIKVFLVHSRHQHPGAKVTRRAVFSTKSCNSLFVPIQKIGTSLALSLEKSLLCALSLAFWRMAVRSGTHNGHLSSTHAW
mmetsp:Transcript_25201/g.50137  ORF Transcript_25201/g.50137 Transcript_25201/m.50137 type:complete len:95 (-) Transcript_25201:738-1022(-)